MAGRIIRGTLSIGMGVSNVRNFQWQDNYEFDRSNADNEDHGDPILVLKGGSGSFELLSGTIDSGHASGGQMTLTYKEKTYSGTGTEQEADKTVTFEKVTLNTGGNIPPDAAGNLTINFDYGTSSVS